MRVELAQKATKLDPEDLQIRNTIGLAYYRVGRYREAAETLERNVSGQSEKYLASDLYLLAMSHDQLGRAELARSYHAWPKRATAGQDELSDVELEELAAFRAEAEKLMSK